MADSYPPSRVLPGRLSEVLEDLTTWFVIGGHAVRCVSPFRPTRAVDLGVSTRDELEALLGRLQRTGEAEILERSDDTVHMRWNGLDVSLFVLDKLVPFVEGRRLGTTGILATKLHAVLDRGARRDFFDLYVMLQHNQLGIAACLSAMRDVYGPHVNEGLLLRALAYFDDAEREAPLPGEGPRDWEAIKDYLQKQVGTLLVPPPHKLTIQGREVDVDD